MLTTAPIEAGPPEFVTAVEGIAEFRLDNGLKVLLFPDPSKPQVTVNLTVLVGSRHEGYGEAGMAHLLEHMVFKGTPSFPGPSDIPKALKDHGAEYNGSTWLDRTNYFETLPATPENLDFALRLEADRMVNSLIKAEELAKEFSVVRNEFEIGENSPSSILEQRMTAVAFEWHNYGKSTIGNRADIERVPIENLRAFYRKYYQPDNAVVIVAGQFDPQQALELIVKYFGAIPRPERVLANTYTEEPAQDGERQVTLRRVGDVSVVGLLYHICSGPHPDYASVDVLEHILAGTPSGRLYKALVETKRAARVSGAAYQLHDPGILKFMAEVAAGNDPGDVLNTMTEIIETASEQGVTEEEVDRSRQHWLKQWELSLADSARIARDLSEWEAQGDWRLIFLYRDRLEQVTPDSVRDAARKYLQRNNRTVGMFLPTEAPERISVPPTPNLAEMIGDYKGREALATGEAFDVAPDSIESRTQRITLASGLKAALLPKKTRGESVQMVLTLRYGDLEGLAGRSTACEILPQLMLRGTKSLSRQQVQDLLDRNRTQVLPRGELGQATFYVESRREFLPAALDLLRQVLREPAFSASEFEILQTGYLSSLQKQLSDPASLARNTISRAINPYAPDDPRYVPTTQESIDRWQALTRDDVAGLYAQFVSGRNGEVSLVGDFDPADIQPLLEQLFADWDAPHGYTRIPRTGRVELTDARQAILTPDKENAVYIAATVFPMNDHDPDYVPLVIGNEIFGSGGLSSRLGDRVRQEEGLSYGIGSMVQARSQDDRAVFYIQAFTNPANMGKVEAAVGEELARLLKDGVTEEELNAARTGYLESQKVERSDDGQLAYLLGTTLEAGRDMTYYADVETRVLQLTPDEVNRALRKWIDPERISRVAAGDFEKAQREPAAGPAGGQ